MTASEPGSDVRSDEDIDASLRAQPEREVFERLVAVCCERRLTIAVAESMTAGEVSLAIASVPDSGRIFLGGATPYAASAKRRVLGLTSASVVCDDAAREMAESVRSLFDADVAVATTGVAGPSPQEGQPPGTLFVAAAVRHGPTISEHHVVGSPDDEPGIIRTRGAGAAGALLLRVAAGEQSELTA